MSPELCVAITKSVYFVLRYVYAALKTTFPSTINRPGVGAAESRGARLPLKVAVAAVMSVTRLLTLAIVPLSDVISTLPVVFSLAMVTLSPALMSMSPLVDVKVDGDTVYVRLAPDSA